MVSLPRTGPATLRYVYLRDPTSHYSMEFNTDHHCITWATRSDLATALSDPRRLAPSQAIHDIGARTGSYESALMEPVVTVRKEAAPSFMEHVLAADSVTGLQRT